jgi:hypothetical protein
MKLATMTIFIYQIRDIVGVTFIFRMRYHKIYMINPVYSCLNRPLCDPHETSQVIKIPIGKRDQCFEKVGMAMVIEVRNYVLGKASQN